MKLNGAQIVCESLLQEGVNVIFGFPGGKVIGLYDTIAKYPALQFVLVRHEQGAAHAADGYARATDKVGVCMATSGPGATNLVTGIANAYMDSVPMVAFTGQVPRADIGKDAFQEIDITGITLPITKHNYLVREASSLAETIKEAFYIAKTGRPGPVLIDIPQDVFVEQTEFHYPARVNLPGYKPTTEGHPSQIKKAAKLISEAERPVVVAGRGIHIAKAHEELKNLAEAAQLPVVTTLLGVSAFPQSHVLSYGMGGMHGMGYANKAVDAADLVIAIGMRFDDRFTGKVSSFAPHAKVIHIDIDPAEIGKNIRVDVPIVGDVKKVLKALQKVLEPKQHVAWLNQLDEWRHTYPCEVRECASVLPQYVMCELCNVTKGDALIVTGVGQHQMWAAQHYIYNKADTFISSGGLGTMGFGLPAAMGVKVGRPDETVWCIDGDGSFQMTLHELATIVQEKLNLKIAIMNNGYLGMVRQWQDLFFGKRYVATPLTGPDFVKIAEAYGMNGIRVTRPEDVRPAIERAMAHDGPFLVDFIVEPEENVYPMVPPGASIAEFLVAPKKEALTWSRRSTP
ncbi:MAG: biosynthetic-type acetolactate synthase large subunit [Dehalococcoidales bacterium]|nr:biosynthetic-type acetolactate synthase large subunit [Dehalococcoidales bacterium]